MARPWPCAYSFRFLIPPPNLVPPPNVVFQEYELLIRRFAEGEEDAFATPACIVYDGVDAFQIPF